ncbi:MAG TPA: ABC transporter substrate-binding protein [Gaiellaceae bacterium]|nr:ABC transporter substrate-binding protein [Gaiellaceae bacterium]
MLRLPALVVAAVAAVLALAAGGATGAPSALVAPAPAATTAQGQFPVTVVTPAGKVTVAKKPRRIVSLSPTATESLFAIGAGPQVVAVDDQSDYPKEAPRTTLSGFTPNVEAIASYRPDLVVIAFDPKGLSTALRRLGITVLHHDGARTLKGAYQQIRQLGLVTGNESGATRVIRRMKERIGRIVKAARPGAQGLSVYHELSPDLYSATSQTFVGKVYEAFGLRNIADAADAAGTGYPQLSAEYVVSANPDLIVLADSVCCGQTPATVAARPGWDRISAVRTGSIVRIHDSIASRWGPRLVDFFRAMSAALARLRT